MPSLPPFVGTERGEGRYSLLKPYRLINLILTVFTPIALEASRRNIMSFRGKNLGDERCQLNISNSYGCQERGIIIIYVVYLTLNSLCNEVF